MLHFHEYYIIQQRGSPTLSRTPHKGMNAKAAGSGRHEIRILRALRKMLRKLLTFGLIGFSVTFLIYMFNLENKLIYKVIYPFLQKHYDSQTRDRRI